MNLPPVLPDAPAPNVIGETTSIVTSSRSGEAERAPDA